MGIGDFFTGAFGAKSNSNDTPEILQLKKATEDAGGEMDAPGGGKYRIIGGNLWHYDAEDIAEEEQKKVDLDSSKQALELNKTKIDRLNLSNTENDKALSDIYSGDFKNPDIQIADPELEKEKAITAQQQATPSASIAKPATFNDMYKPSPLDTVQFNKSTLGGIGQAGLNVKRGEVAKRSPLDYYSGKVGKFAGDNPNVKETMADLQKQADLESAAKTAEQARVENNAFRSDENQKTKDFQKQQAEDQRSFLKMMQDIKDHEKNSMEGIDPDTGKPYTSGKYVAAGYAFRAKESNDISEKLYHDGFDAGKVANAVMRPDKLNLLKDPAQRQYAQAARNFVNTILRPESGAVIADSEFLNAYRQYFAQPGDDAATQEQKRLNRIQKIAGLKAQAGRAYDVVQKEYNAMSNVQEQSATTGFSVVAPNGKTYKFNNQVDLDAFKKKAGL